MDSREFEVFLREELESCYPEERALFERTKTAVERRPFVDKTYLEDAFVVAFHRDEVMYYNEIEEGFNTSPVDEHGAIMEYWCSQDSLQGALHLWLSAEEVR